MRLEVNPLEGESQRGCSALLEASLPTSWSAVYFLAMYVAIAITAYFVAPSAVFATVLISIAAVFATIYILRWDWRFRTRRLQGKDPHLLETHYIELNPDGIRSWCAHVDARYPWAEYVKTVDTPEFLLLLQAGGGGNAIPKRLLNTQAEAELHQRLAEWAPHLVASESSLHSPTGRAI